MKKATRICSAVLAVAMAASCTLPVFAAESKPTLQKNETVYAVLESDGSIRSQTVSEHLYSANGLSAVQDKSILTDIENTQTTATFVQNGDTLQWQADDTDVYYKGTTDRQLPVTAQITYTLDGKTVTADELSGQSGHLVISIALTNHETDTITVEDTTRTICTPFVTAVGVTLDESAENVTAEHGTLQQLSGTQIAAFVCLPGVRSSLDGLLPDQLDELEDYLLDTVTVEADVTDFSAPSIMIACATDTDALQQGGFENIADLKGLADDLEQLSDAMEQLTDGAKSLTDGAQALLDGVAQLNDGSLALVNGAAQLNDGASSLENGLQQLSEGLDTLRSNNSALNAGAQQIADGVLASANSTLLESGLITEPLTWDNYSAVLDEALGINENTLAATRTKILKTIHASAPNFKDNMLDLALYIAATTTDGDLTAALEKMNNLDPVMLTAEIAMKKDPEAADQLIHDCLVNIAATSDDLAEVRALKENLSLIAYFVRSVGQYTDGVAAAADGAHSAADGSAQLAAGISTLYDGTISLSNGTNSLYSGTSQLHDGTSAMEDGINQLNDEGISKLTSAISADQLRQLETVTSEMQTRLENYTSFAGAPDDAEVKVCFLLKTAEATSSAEETAATVETTTVKQSFWQRLVALFSFLIPNHS
jgi:putative membrane protein